MTEQAESQRASLVAAAQAQWVSALTDLGGRNTLLYFKDRRAGTLDLAPADPAALDHLLATGSIRLTRLFDDVDIRADAIRRVQAIYRKARELSEERGLSASYLATGMARWDELFLEPAAPVLLRGLTITPTRARHDDFDLTLDDASEVNPVLLHKLATVHGADTEALAAEPVPPADIYDQLAALAKAAEIPGFEITGRQVIGTFTYAKLPMVRDLQNAAELLADSDVVAAIAGDPQAQAVVAADTGPGPLLDAIPPADDYSILDADSSQRSAINAVVRGQSLVIHGPPGTGKSQTIANLIAALVARGRKVLFVAEKRAAIDAVLTRLKGADLGEVVLDIHDGARDRQRIAADLGAALDRARQIPEPETGSLHRRLVDRQQRLSQHVTALHEVHEPWGVTPFAAQSALLGVPEEARPPVRLASPDEITGAVAEQLRDELREFTHLGGRPPSRRGPRWQCLPGSHPRATRPPGTGSSRRTGRPGCARWPAIRSGPSGWRCSPACSPPGSGSRRMSTRATRRSSRPQPRPAPAGRRCPGGSGARCGSVPARSGSLAGPPPMSCTWRWHRPRPSWLPGSGCAPTAARRGYRTASRKRSGCRRNAKIS
jgi:hypothetical protein